MIASHRVRLHRPHLGLSGLSAMIGAFGLAAGAGAQCTPTWTGVAGETDWDCYAVGTGPSGVPGPAEALYVGGGFGLLHGQPAKRVARWDGWAVSGMDGGVGNPAAFDMAWVNVIRRVDAGPGVPPGVYVGGQFTVAGTLPVQNLAHWSGTEWSDVGGGVYSAGTPQVFAIREYDEDGPGPQPPSLFVGGIFPTAGWSRVPAKAIARWNGQDWSAVGAPLATTSPTTDPTVDGLEVFDADGPGPGRPHLYATGSFMYAGSTVVNRIARWDGRSWTPVGQGLLSGGPITAMCVFDPDGAGPTLPRLYVGAQLAIGYPGACGVCAWNGREWSGVGGCIGVVRAMAVFDDDGPGRRLPSLFAGGFLLQVPGGPIANRIARWDGKAWTTLGLGLLGGTAGSVDSLAVFDEDGPGPNPGGLYVSGNFTSAGGVHTENLARWGCPLPPRCEANCTNDVHPITGAPILTVQDFGCFQTRYVLQDPYADCNGDGALSVADFGCFQTKFVAGCP